MEQSKKVYSQGGCGESPRTVADQAEILCHSQIQEQSRWEHDLNKLSILRVEELLTYLGTRWCDVEPLEELSNSTLPELQGSNPGKALNRLSHSACPSPKPYFHSTSVTQWLIVVSLFIYHFAAFKTPSQIMLLN